MKKIQCFIFSFFVFVNIVYSQDPNAKNHSDAINYFVYSIKNGNIERALQICPYNYDHIVRKFDAKESIKYMGSILPETTNLPSQYLLLNKLDMLSHFGFYIRRFIWSLLLNDKLSDLKDLNPIPNPNDSLINEYLTLLDLARLKSLEIVRVDLYRPDIQQSSERNIRLKSTQQKIYGFDEQWQYTVLYKCNNKYYVGGFFIERYNDNWYISNLGCFLANISSGQLIQVSGIVEYLYKYEYELN